MNVIEIISQIYFISSTKIIKTINMEIPKFEFVDNNTIKIG